MMTGNKKCLSLFVAGLVLSFFSIVEAQPCKQEKGITSNYIAQLSGYGDTLCMLTVDPNRFALNSIMRNSSLDSHTVTMETNWSAYYPGNDEYIINMTSGGGWLVSCVDSGNWLDSSYFINVKITDPCNKPQKKRFNWPEDISSEDNLLNLSTTDAVYLNGSFYFACMDGGVAEWNPEVDNITIFTPGLSGNAIENITLANKPDSLTRVTGVNATENSLIVTTPSRIWVLNTVDSSWDSSIQSEFSDSDLSFEKFESVFVKNDSLPVLYAVIKVRDQKREKWQFFKYDDQNRFWRVLLDEDNVPKAVSFGPNEYIYMLTGDNTVQVYRDTTGDTLINQNLKTVKRYSSELQARMIKKYDIDIPDLFEDILFVQTGDEYGYLWIATSEGLFFSEQEIPGISTGAFNLIKRAPKLQPGLKKTYARPGILTAGGFDEKESRSVFIYNLSENAKVTIKIYDYNMDLVKTVIQGKNRKAGNDGGPFGRSTLEREDFWDGRNSSGKKVAPGVYYYKITTDTGERAFGKIVVAK